MSLQIPTVDDRSFDDLMEEAKALIPQYNSDWTNFNPGDPGIMLIELFAWLTESTLYRMDQVPEKNIIKFLNILGVNPGELEEAPDETVEQAIARAIKQNSELRSITDNDIDTIVLEVLAEYGLDGKVYVLNNRDFSLFDKGPVVASLKRDGHMSVIVVPAFKINKIVAASEKKKVKVEDFKEEVNNPILEALGGLDDFYEEETIEEDLPVTSYEAVHDTNQEFGYAVSLYGTNLLIGSPGRNGEGDVKNVGIAYIYKINEDGELEKDINKEIIESDLVSFGKSLSMGEHYAIIGAPDDERAYIFGPDGKGGWQESMVLSSSSETGEKFGSSVCINNNFAIVGAEGSETGSGAAYIFMRHVDGTWKKIQTLSPSGGEDGGRFGASVSISGRSAVISAPGKDSGPGAVYVYKLDTNNIWQELKMLTPSALSDNNSHFGKSVHIDNEYIIVGADNTAYVFKLRKDGSVLKSDFQDEELVSLLLGNKVIKSNINDHNYAYFDNAIENEDQLKERLEYMGISEISLILEAWRRSLDDNWNEAALLELPLNSKIEAVSISNYTAVVSAMVDEKRYVYIYRTDAHDNWTLVKTIEDRGIPASLHGNRLAMGQHENVKGGAVHFYTLPIITGIDDHISFPGLNQCY